MSKVAKTVGKVAGAVAAVALIGSGIGAALGGTMMLTAFGASIAASTIATVGGAIAMGASLLVKKPKISGNATDRLHASLDPNTPRKFVLGHTAMATDIIYQTFTGAKQEFYHQILCVAAHQVQAIDEIWFDNELAWNGTPQGRFAGYLTAQTRLVGVSGAGIPIDAGWGANHSLTGCAYIYLRFKLTGNSKKTESPFQSIPTRVTIRGKGALVPDVRVGGVSAADQGTWTYGAESGRNPALQLLWYLLGWRINGKLSVGRGIPVERIDVQSFMTAANVCDEPVALAAGGTEPRYRADGVFSEGDDPGTVISNLEAAMNGRLRDAGGKIALIIFKNDLASPVQSFTEADIIGDDLWRQTPSIDDTFNIVRGRYVDASNNSLYQLAEYPEIALPSTDGIERIDTFDLPVVQSSAQAQRLANTRLKRRQYSGAFSANVNAKGWAVTLGDVVTLSHAALGWTDKLFRVTRHGLAMNGVVPIELLEEHPSIYAWSASDAPAVEAASPAVYDPLNNPVISSIVEAESLNVTTLISTSSQVGLSITASNVAATLNNHTRRYSDKDVAVSGASVGGLAADTFYYLYYDDADRVGGAVTYGATTTGSVAFASAANPFRHFAGHVRTALDSTGTTTGGGSTPPGYSGENISIQ